MASVLIISYFNHEVWVNSAQNSASLFFGLYSVLNSVLPTIKQTHFIIHKTELDTVISDAISFLQT